MKTKAFTLSALGVVTEISYALSILAVALMLSFLFFI